MTQDSKEAYFNKLLSQLFQQENWQQRSEAARELGVLKDARATNLLCRALKNEKDPSVINRIIEAMGKIGDPKATTTIIDKLKEELNKFEGDKYRIIYILESLTGIRDKRALSYIGPFLNSPDDQLKDLSTKAFDAIEPKWREILNKVKKEKSIEEIFGIKI